MAVNPRGSSASLLRSCCTPPDLVPDGVVYPTGAFGTFLAEVKTGSVRVGAGEAGQSTVGTSKRLQPSSPWRDTESDVSICHDVTPGIVLGKGLALYVPVASHSHLVCPSDPQSHKVSHSTPLPAIPFTLLTARSRDFPRTVLSIHSLVRPPRPGAQDPAPPAARCPHTVCCSHLPTQLTSPSVWIQAPVLLLPIQTYCVIELDSWNCFAHLTLLKEGLRCLGQVSCSSSSIP